MSFEMLFDRHRWMWLAALLTVATGCGGGASSGHSEELNSNQVRVMQSLYQEYLSRHKNQVPPNEQAFRDFLGTKQDKLKEASLTVDDVFVSPRGGQPLQWIYGSKLSSNRVGANYLAYEPTPVDGKRLVIADRGIQLMEDSDFRQLFPNVP